MKEVAEAARTLRQRNGPMTLLLAVAALAVRHLLLFPGMLRLFLSIAV